jgi:hypothetical protein
METQEIQLFMEWLLQVAAQVALELLTQLRELWVVVARAEQEHLAQQVLTHQQVVFHIQEPLLEQVTAVLVMLVVVAITVQAVLLMLLQIQQVTE